MITVEHILELKEDHVVSVSPDATVREAVEFMSDAQVGCVVVEEEDGTAIGIFSERDLVQRVIAAGLDPETVPVGEVMSWPVVGCSPKDDLKTCAELLDELQSRHLPVMVNDKIIGLVSARDILAVAFE